jgi:hypothetical protein
VSNKKKVPLLKGGNLQLIHDSKPLVLLNYFLVISAHH